jgi:hypothetical protein
MRPILTAEIIMEIIRDEPGWTRTLIGAFFRGEEPLFLGACLSKCLMILRLLREVRNPLVENLAEIGNPITPAVVQAFANLREWFDFKPEVFTDV